MPALLLQRESEQQNFRGWEKRRRRAKPFIPFLASEKPPSSSGKHQLLGETAAESGPWPSSMKPSEAPAAESSCVSTSARGLIPRESSVPTSKTQAPKRTHFEVHRNKTQIIICSWSVHRLIIFFPPKKTVLKSLSHSCLSSH